MNKQIPRKTLSLCMIVKNEEDNLRDCLNCVTPFADEIIIVDTGSTDGTKRIADSFSARIYDFPWNDSFSDARNESIRHAKGDWILWLDADDRIDKKWADLLGRLKHVSPEDVVYCFEIVNTTAEGNPSSFMQMRMFPNNKNLRFSGRIHESIGKSAVDGGMKIEYTDLKIIHAGYHTPEEVQRKMFRNLRLLEMDLAENPMGTAHLYELAQTHRALGNHKKALELLLRIMDIPEEKQLQKQVYAQTPADIAQIFLEQNNLPEAGKWVEKAISLNQDNITARFICARIFEREHRTDEARAAYNYILTTEFQISSIPVNIQHYKNQAAAALQRLQP